MSRRRHPNRSKVRKHTFEYDAELSRDGRMWCRQCGLPGERGDARHFGDEHQAVTSAAQADSRRRAGDR